MARKVSNLLLALISALILLFIAIAFYDAFTREPVNREEKLNSSSTSGSISSPSTTSTSTDSPLAPSATSTTTVESPGTHEDAIQSAYEESTETPQESSTDATPDSSASDTETVDTTEPVDTTTASDTTATTEPSEDSSHILREKPELRDALPPVPSAPPSPVLSPPDTSSQEAFSTTTDNATTLPLNTDPVVNDSAQFPAPISDFPAPVIPTGTVRPINPVAPINPTSPVAPSAPNQNFPAPSDTPSGIPLNPTPGIPNTDFPAPLGMKASEEMSSVGAAVAAAPKPTAAKPVARKPTPHKVANTNKSSAETLQLRQLRNEKEQLRRSLGLQ